jgi:AcrR family transcriptional regulator
MQALLDSAERAMVARGYDKATMHQIAAAAGCATGTFYLYFKNKELLFQAIVARHAKEMFEAARAQVQIQQDPLDKVRAGLQGILHYAQQHRPFFRLFFTALPMRHRMIPQKVHGSARRWHDQYNRMELELLRQAQKKGRIRRDLPPEILQGFMEDVSFSVIEQFSFSASQTSAQQQMKVLWGLITRGIAGLERP